MRRSYRGGLSWAVAGAAAGVALLAAPPLSGHAAEEMQVPAAGAAEHETTSRIGGRFILNTHDGRTVTDESFRGRHLLVFFGYTHCPDICPTSLQTIAATLELLGSQADKVQPLFVTLDPERDSQSLLAQYVTNFHPRLIGLRGPATMITRLSESYKVKSARAPVPGGDEKSYAIDHTAAVFHMGPDGAYVGRFGHATPPEEMAARIRATLKP